MTANIGTVLILGATSGLGEGFARYLHSKGKKVIATGRRVKRLSSLQTELEGLSIVQIDVEDIGSLEGKLQEVIKPFPGIDSILIMDGIMAMVNFKLPATSSTASVASEITTNLAAPILVARTFVPHLLSYKRPTTFITVTSRLGFIPVPLYPVYSATKAAIHIFSVSLRSQLAGSNHREQGIVAQGGLDKASKSMPYNEYMKSATEAFEKDGDKEIAIGFPRWESVLGVERLGLY
ncbi:NAD(P)-binding protein [Cadophora sp. DSE1049]|nr:NAD(P)-binding protein [Cadophora sp. DSE1049]